MKPSLDVRRDVVLPIVVSMGVFCTLNFLWAFFGLDRFVPKALSVYMVGSLVAIALLAWLIHRGTLTLEDVGLGDRGWRPLRRLFALLLTVFFVTYLYFNPPEELARPLEFDAYCFWLFFLLQASLAELLIFLALAYCLPETWLRTRGWPTWQIILVAGLFSSVTFGWHHYTGEKEYHQWSWATIPVMWINLAYFIPARNFHLTFLLHNSIAAVGFTQQQFSVSTARHLQELIDAGQPAVNWQNPATYNTPFYITVFIVSFALPYLLLHGVEWWARSRRPIHAPASAAAEIPDAVPVEAS
jgi:hypothetical protein